MIIGRHTPRTQDLSTWLLLQFDAENSSLFRARQSNVIGFRNVQDTVGAMLCIDTLAQGRHRHAKQYSSKISVNSFSSQDFNIVEADEAHIDHN